MDTAKPTQKVDSRHKLYDANQPKRDLYRAVKGGTAAIREGGERYLPKFAGEEAADYTERKGMATIDGIVADGVAGFCGKVFHEPMDMSKVSIATDITDNIDLQGNKLDVFARKAFDAAFDGHSVILIDAPAANTPIVSLEDERSQGIRPYWRLYEAKDVTNWRQAVDPRTKQTILTLLVLKEVTEEPDGEFGVKEVTRYRVYRDTGVVTVEVWRKLDQTAPDGSQFIIEQPPMTLDLTAIPAAIVGSLECEPWLLNESQMEVKAYQKESAFDMIEYMSVPIFATIGYPMDAPALKMGPKAHLRLPDSATGKTDAKFVQIDAAGHTSLKATIEGIKKEIAAKLDAVTNDAMPETEQTATEVVSDDSKSQAKLIVWAAQLEDALNLALQFTAEFQGGKDGGRVALRPAWVVAKEKAEEQKDFDRTIITEETKAKVGRLSE